MDDTPTRSSETKLEALAKAVSESQRMLSAHLARIERQKAAGRPVAEAERLLVMFQDTHASLQRRYQSLLGQPAVEDVDPEPTSPEAFR